MGLFGLFERKAGGALRKHAERVANKRAQAQDRWESIQFLLRDGSPEAIDALLQRFGFYVDPSITDQEEKDTVFDGIVRLGDQARPSVLRYLARSESLGWGLKVLDKLLPPSDVVTTVIELLTPMDTEYERDPQRKVQLIAALEDREDLRIAAAVARFLSDANETVRFHAAGAVLAQQNAPEHQRALLDCLCAEESVRIRNRILEAFASRQWTIADRRGEVNSRITPGFKILVSGAVQRA